jgi:uncharacterized membrane protein
MQAELIVLRIVHVLCGVMWVGTAVFMGFFLAPALSTMGPAAGQVMGGLQKRKFMIVLPVVAVLTLLTGLRLMMIMSSNFGAGYFQTAMGRTFAGAGVAAILAFVVGIIVNRPTMEKMGQLQQSMASDPVSKDAIAAEIRRLQSRMVYAGTVVTLLLIVATFGMAIARYM